MSPRRMHDMVWKGVELVEPVTIGAHDPGCTGINEPFVQEVDILDIGISHVGIANVRGEIIVNVSEGEIFIDSRDVVVT